MNEEMFDYMAVMFNLKIISVWLKKRYGRRGGGNTKNIKLRAR